MNGLARMLLDSGASISGSERELNLQTVELAQLGANISQFQNGELLTADIDLVVRTAAVRDDNPEFIEARRLGLKTIKYAELLGQVMQERLGVAVAGTHGKSTTTAMISYALLQCGADPSFVVGGTAPQLGGRGSRSGAGRAFVAEACEFDRSFHNLRPRVAIVTNIEEDHLDCYKGIDDIVESFREFARLVPRDGLILANGQDDGTRRAVHGLAAPVEWVTLQPDQADAAPLNRHGEWCTHITGDNAGRYCGKVLHDGRVVADLALSIAGRHNLFNATMAVAACRACGVDPAAAAAAIGLFRGVDRRMTEVGTFAGATVVDDYGHHPTEIRATLSALRERYSPRRLLCVFQPHQHSRTRFLLDDFAASFGQADETIVLEIYFVRDSEDERARVSAEHLVEKVRAQGRSAVHLPDFAQIVEYLRGHARPGDLIVTMGAGDVWKIGKDLVCADIAACGVADQ
jgi:UDP-N-acetylmuramate--alanine ligase